MTLDVYPKVNGVCTELPSDVAPKSTIIDLLRNYQVFPQFLGEPFHVVGED